MSDDELMVLVREGETDLREGWDVRCLTPHLPLRLLLRVGVCVFFLSSRPFRGSHVNYLWDGEQDADLRHEVLEALKEAKARPSTFTMWETDVDEYPEDYDGPKPTVHGSREDTGGR
jgi:hypothetical protein